MMTVDECPVMSISAANNRFKDSSWQKHDFLSFHCQLQRHYSNTAPSYHQFNYRRHIRKRFRQKINYNENSSGSEPVEEVDKKNCGFTLAMRDEHDYVYGKVEEGEFNLDIDDGYDDEKRRDFGLHKTSTFFILVYTHNI